MKPPERKPTSRGVDGYRDRLDATRAQTSVDFLIGFSIFSMTLILALQMTTGSTVNTAPESMTAEAAAERTAAFTHQNYTEGDGSLLDQGYDDVWSGVKMPATPQRHEVNITVHRVEDGGCPLPGNCTTGPKGDVPENTTAKITGESRVAVVNGNVSRIDVRVWENGTGGTT